MPTSISVPAYPTNKADAYQDKLADMGAHRDEYGVHRGFGQEFGCTPVAGLLKANVLGGSGAVQGIDGDLFTASTLDFASADPADDRVDLVVLSLHKSPNPLPYEMVVEILPGTPSDWPAAPAPRRTASVADVPLWKVRVRAGASALTGADITDAREWSNSVRQETLVIGTNRGLTFINGAGGEVATVSPRSDIASFSEADMIWSTPSTAHSFRWVVGESERFSIGGDNIVRANNNLRVGQGLSGDPNSGPFVDINPFNEHAHFRVGGSQPNIGMRFSSKGTSGFEFYADNDASRVFVLIDQAGNVGGAYETGLAIRSENILKRVYVGAVDSGGSGRRILTVVN